MMFAFIGFLLAILAFIILMIVFVKEVKKEVNKYKPTPPSKKR